MIKRMCGYVLTKLGFEMAPVITSYIGKSFVKYNFDAIMKSPRWFTIHDYEMARANMGTTIADRERHVVNSIRASFNESGIRINNVAVHRLIAMTPRSEIIQELWREGDEPPVYLMLMSDEQFMQRYKDRIEQRIIDIVEHIINDETLPRSPRQHCEAFIIKCLKEYENHRH